jgi:hypothetical protein
MIGNFDDYFQDGNLVYFAERNEAEAENRCGNTNVETESKHKAIT